MLKLLPLALMLTVGSTPAISSECNSGSALVFSCVTAKGKRIQLCDAGATIDYSFGKAGAEPEIVVRAPRGAASTFQWQGIGRYLSYSVQVPNGATTYTVFWGMDRLTEGHPVDAGVTVEINGKFAAEVKCNAKKRILQNIEGIDLRPAD